MVIPTDLKYTSSHEWVRLENDGTVTVGITDHAQELLGDMVFVENPEVGRQLSANQECAVVESVKAASDVYAPLAGVVIAANDNVVNAPEKINADPYVNWMFKMKATNVSDLDQLMDATAYKAMLQAEKA